MKLKNKYKKNTGWWTNKINSFETKTEGYLLTKHT